MAMDQRCATRSPEISCRFAPRVYPPFIPTTAGRTPVYFRRLLDKVEIKVATIDGVKLVKDDVSAKSVPLPTEVTREEAVEALKRAGHALVNAEIVDVRVHTVYSSRPSRTTCSWQLDSYAHIVAYAKPHLC